MKRIEAMILGLSIVIAAIILGVMIRPQAGRFQIQSSSGVNVFVLDTETGKLWSKFVAKNAGPTRWTPEVCPWQKK